jgi:ABC-type transport system involved in multi-copper enzyme maturation permease subunit
MAAILALLMGTTGILCIGGAVAIWRNGVHMGPNAIWEIAGVSSYILHLIFGLLMLAAIAPNSMAEERQRGSLDILAATALSTRTIVVGKWLGTFRLVLLMAIGPGLMALAMATARSPANFAPARGLPPDFYRVPTLGARCYGVIVLIATIVAHGALITSVGLAMAVWIKRQSRAIAMSVGSFILVTAAWPTVVSNVANPDQSRILASLSPVVACVQFANYFTNRGYAFFRGLLWCGTFWAVEVFALAMGLLWLTVLTFDRCFDRIPDRPQRIPIRTVVVMILAGMIGAGSLVGATDIWIEGVNPASLSRPISFGISAYFLLIAIGLVLVALESAKSGRPAWNIVAATAPGLAARSFVPGRWWKSFRLVLLLAIGPALLAMALATAHKAPRYEAHFTTDSMGNKAIDSYVLAKADNPYVAEARLGQRLLIAAQLIVTILVHGGAAISVGLGLTTANAWSRCAIATVVGLAFLAVFILQPAYSLLSMLVTRTSFSVGDTVSSMILWDIVVAVLAFALSAWTIWAWQLESDLSDGAPTVSTVLVGD